MAISYGSMANTVTDGLFIYLDAKNPKSYPGSGSTWYNLVSSSYNATKDGSQSPTWPKYNPTEGCFTFTGGVIGNNYSRFDIDNIPSNNNATVEAWFRTTEVPTDGFQRFVLRAGGPDANLYQSDPYQLQLFSTCWSAGESYADASYCDYGIAANDGSWHSMAFTFNYSTQVMKAYYDGIYKGQGTQAGAAVPITGHSMRIGTRNDLYCCHFIGDIAMIKFYTTTLSDADILQNYNALKRRFNR